MTKKVVWTSCTRLSCACVTPSPPVILCLTDASLLAPQLCPDGETETTYPFTTLPATLVKSWKLQDVCQKTSWSYSFEYDETLLADLDTALTSAQIEGAFCEGCITTWVRDEVGDEVSVIVEGTDVTITTQHGCVTSFSISGEAGSPIIPIDTDSVDLTVTGVDQHTIQADVNISADAGNLITIEADGLLAEQTDLSVVDTSTIDFSVSGTANHTLTGSVKISPDAGNATSAHANGIYTPVSPTSVSTGSGCVTVGASSMVRAASIAGSVLTITGAPEHTAKSASGANVFAPLGVIVPGTYVMLEIAYARVGDTCRSMLFLDYGAQSHEIAIGAGSQVQIKSWTNLNGGAYTLNSINNYGPTVSAWRGPMTDGAVNTGIAALGPGVSQTIGIRYEIVVVANPGGVEHYGGSWGIASLGVTV